MAFSKIVIAPPKSFAVLLMNVTLFKVNDPFSAIIAPPYPSE